MEIKSVWVNDLSGMQLELDVVVKGEIEYQKVIIAMITAILNISGLP